MTGLHLRRRAALRTVPMALAPAALRLQRALRDPERAQARVKRQVAADMAQTAYGRAHGVRGAGDFEALPVADWDDLAPWVARQQEGELAITASEVRFYEKTSGSSGSAKLVPYTDALRHGFSEMFAAWAYDVLQHAPKLRTGKLYMSVSPSLGEVETAGGVPIGLTDDADYLEGWMQPLVRRFLVGPSAGRRYPDGEAFKDAVATALLAEPDLEVVSVWNPSFFEVLLDHIRSHRRRFASVVDGPRRPALLAGEEPHWAVIWPRLALLSCWDQGAAAPMATRLHRRLPHAMLQGKGLLATEAAVSVPLVRAAGAVPLVHTAVIELIAADGTLHGVHEAEVGAEYEVVVSPRGGLPRYRLGDRVEVTHLHGVAPCLRFVGRASAVSDLVGEKLHEHFARAALERVLSPDALGTLVPRRGPPASYTLLTDRPVAVDLGARLDRLLREAHHYDLARSLGQLGPLTVAMAPQAGEWLAQREIRRGLTWGDIKPRALQLHPADTLLVEQIGAVEA